MVSEEIDMKRDVAVYGADWCGDTLRTLRDLDDLGVDYTYVNIDNDQEAESKVIEFNQGRRRIPMVEIEGERMSVPSRDDLTARLG